MTRNVIVIELQVPRESFFLQKVPTLRGISCRQLFPIYIEKIQLYLRSSYALAQSVWRCDLSSLQVLIPRRQNRLPIFHVPPLPMRSFPSNQNMPEAVNLPQVNLALTSFVSHSLPGHNTTLCQELQVFSYLMEKKLSMVFLHSSSSLVCFHVYFQVA